MGSLSPDSKAASHAAQLHLTDSDTRIYFASVNMGDKKIKLTYFDLRARGEPCRLLLAYGGIKYEDERIAPPWDPTSTWASLKPTTPFGQLPVLNWDGVEICQSMAAARFIAREVGLAGNNSLEQAQVDEVVDVIQDLINAWVKLYFAKDEEGLKKFADVTLQTALTQLEKKLTARGGQYFVGNNLTWADLHVFMYATDAVDKAVLAKFPKLANLTERVGNVPNIKAWVESRPKTDL